MYRYPSVREAKTHAKHLSRTFDLKRSEAQEITAYQFDCYDWSDLLTKACCEASSADVETEISFINLLGQSRVDEFKALVLPHIDAIKKHFNKDIHVHGCILHKILEGKFNQISGDAIDGVLYTMNEPSEDGVIEAWSSEDLISELEFRDDTVSRILSDKSTAKFQPQNGHIEPSLYGFSFYAYYLFNGKKVNITVREFDLDICRPSKDGKLDCLSICDRSWFGKYFIAYLRLIIQQLRSVGYSGTVRIRTIQNVQALDLYHNRKGHTHHDAVYSVFKELLSMGGEFNWNTDDDGRKWDLGVELPFELNPPQWMLGEKRL